MVPLSTLEKSTFLKTLQCRWAKVVLDTWNYYDCDVNSTPLFVSEEEQLHTRTGLLSCISETPSLSGFGVRRGPATPAARECPPPQGGRAES